MNIVREIILNPCVSDVSVLVTYPATHRPGYATFKPSLGLLSLTDTFLKFKDA
jgi:hypothetical protein